MSSASPAGQPVEQWVEDVRDRLNRLMYRHLPPEIGTLLIPMRGKLNRARLLLAFAFLGDRLNRAALALAQGVELLHLASLIQDDLVDRAAFRHGAKAVYHVMGAGGTVLLSDWLFGQAYHFFYLGTTGQANPVPQISRLVKRMALSELRQELALNKGQAGSITACLRYNHYKTALFFQTCCRLGMQTTGRGTGAVTLAGQIGLWWGMAYQLNNDLQDLAPGPGEVPGNDQDRSKGLLTLPLVLLLQREPALQEVIFRIPLIQLWEVLKQSGCIAECGRWLGRFLTRAESGLDRLNLRGEPEQIIREWLQIMKYKGLMRYGELTEGDPNRLSGEPQRIPTLAKEFGEK